MASTTIAGFASGIIVALAIMAGLSAGTESAQAVLSGIVVVALVEGFSDAYSEYLSQKTEGSKGIKEVWKESIILFSTKFFIILQFILPFIILPAVGDATQFAIFWGLFILSIISGYIAKQQETKRIIRSMTLYVVAAILIVTITYFAGDLVQFIFTVFGIS
jgi:VIT1/CCC1 family predicted Fe2+/Mn2+ transporter